MKKRTHVFTTHLLSEFTRPITEANRRAAMTAYLESDRHRQLLIADLLVHQCDESIRGLKGGAISPHLDVCCCEDTFAAILSGFPYITYDGVSLPSESDENGDLLPDKELDRALTPQEYARLSKLSGKRLIEVLCQEFDCDKTSFGSLHEKDNDALIEYRAAVTRRFRAAAEYALRIGSSSAALWLEAIRQIQPRNRVASAADDVLSIPCRTDIRVEDVRAAYETAEKAQAQLWVDDALCDLKASVTRESSKARR